MHPAWKASLLQAKAAKQAAGQDMRDGSTANLLEQDDDDIIFQ